MVCAMAGKLKIRGKQGIIEKSGRLATHFDVSVGGLAGSWLANDLNYQNQDPNRAAMPFFDYAFLLIISYHVCIFLYSSPKFRCSLFVYEFARRTRSKGSGQLEQSIPTTSL